MLRIALPKGDSLEERTLELFKAAGATVVSEPRKYTIKVLLNSGAHEAVIMRSRHIPTLVAEGRYDVGICGEDRAEETGAHVQVVAQLPYNRATNGAVRVVLFTDKGNKVRRIAQIPPGTRIFSEYPKLTRRVFRERNIRVRVIDCAGTAEAHVPRDYPYGVCVSETGATLAANGLKPIATLFESTTVLIANPRALHDQFKSGEIEALRQSLVAAMELMDVSTPSRHT